MKDADYEWDDVKSASNHADHGVTFDMARAVFDDPFAVGWLDERMDYGEARYSTVGLSDGRLLYVASR